MVGTVWLRLGARTAADDPDPPTPASGQGPAGLNEERLIRACHALALYTELFRAGSGVAIGVFFGGAVGAVLATEVGAGAIPASVDYWVKRGRKRGSGQQRWTHYWKLPARLL